LIRLHQSFICIQHYGPRIQYYATLVDLRRIVLAAADTENAIKPVSESSTVAAPKDRDYHTTPASSQQMGCRFYMYYTFTNARIVEEGDGETPHASATRLEDGDAVVVPSAFASCPSHGRLDSCNLGVKEIGSGCLSYFRCVRPFRSRPLCLCALIHRDGDSAPPSLPPSPQTRARNVDCRELSRSFTVGRHASLNEQCKLT
jgi:hypothetical protein